MVVGAGWGGGRSGFARLGRRAEGACSSATSGALRFRSARRAGGAGAAEDWADRPPAALEDASACLAAWRAEERVVGLLDDMSKY